jgi:hypothetical protein
MVFLIFKFFDSRRKVFEQPLEQKVTLGRIFILILPKLQGKETPFKNVCVNQSSLTGSSMSHNTR